MDSFDFPKRLQCRRIAPDKPALSPCFRRNLRAACRPPGVFWAVPWEGLHEAYLRIGRSGRRRLAGLPGRGRSAAPAHARRRCRRHDPGRAHSRPLSLARGLERSEGAGLEQRAEHARAGLSRCASRSRHRQDGAVAADQRDVARLYAAFRQRPVRVRALYGRVEAAADARGDERECGSRHAARSCSIPTRSMRKASRPSTGSWPRRTASALRCRCRRTAARTARCMSTTWRAGRRSRHPSRGCNSRRPAAALPGPPTATASGTRVIRARTRRKPTGISTCRSISTSSAAIRKRPAGARREGRAGARLGSLPRQPLSPECDPRDRAARRRRRICVLCAASRCAAAADRNL